MFYFQYKSALGLFDKEILGLTLELLEKEIPRTNLILVGDHGFVDTSSNRTQFLEDFLDVDTQSYVMNTYGSMTDLRPKNGFTVDQIMQNLTALNSSGHFKVYR